jgi:predicted murein hydrolase (TIGR00659 family)
MINPFGLILSVGLFKGFQKLKINGKSLSCPPVLLAGIVIIVILKCFNIDFTTYNESGKILTLMLIPAVVALGYPIYKHQELLLKNKRIIYFGFLFATIFAILSTYFVAKFAHADLRIIVSMLPKSVTAPIAVEISKGMGGVPELTACVAVLTGVFGAVFGHKLLKLFKVKHDIAIGLAMGAASHVIGTARCAEKGRDLQVVMASLALVIVGILTAILAPVFVHIIS